MTCEYRVNIVCDCSFKPQSKLPLHRVLRDCVQKRPLARFLVANTRTSASYEQETFPVAAAHTSFPYRRHHHHNNNNTGRAVI